jgi:hypothetical protein
MGTLREYWTTDDGRVRISDLPKEEIQGTVSIVK